MCKTVMMTGTCTVFGKLVADAIASEGYSVVAAMHSDSKRYTAVAKELNEQDNIEVVNVDLTHDDSVNNAVSQILKKYGAIDVLINNVGVAGFGTIESTSTIEQIKSFFEVNYLGVLRSYQAVLPSMCENRNGLIIDITYDSGPSKFALHSIANSIRGELKEFGIENVNLRYKSNLVQLDGLCSTNDSFQSIGENHSDLSDVAFENVMDTAFEEIYDLYDNALAIADGVVSIIKMKSGTRPNHFVQ